MIFLHIIIGLLLLAAVVAGVVICAVCGYGFLLLRKRPLRALYEARAADEDFCPLASIPQQMIRYFLLVEDEKFYEHRGYVPEAIRDAFRMNLKQGEIITGGSTITQQLVKNLYFDFRKSYWRKLVELFLAVVAERQLGKDRILEFYFNIIYFGVGIYGITDAVDFYFQKKISDLTTNQMFILACMPYAPTKGNPVRQPEVFERIRNQRLDYWVDRHRISDEEAGIIRSFDAAHLDDELRSADAYTENYSREVVLTNERFGPF